MKHVVTIVGARPQFIKAAAVSRAMAMSSGMAEKIVHTGQHYDQNMSDVFFEQMQIPKPHFHLGIGGRSHGAMTGRQLEGIESVLVQERPDVVLVYGDTNSTLAGALAATKLHIPVAHVEAGLRSRNRRMPEEINRVLTDHCADILFAPTDAARKNLLEEGVASENIHVVGDVMFDTAIYYRNQAVAPDVFESLNVETGAFILCTVHRAETTDDADRLAAIMDGLGRASLPVIIPIHPRTKENVQKFGIAVPNNVHLIDPVGYFEMTWLEANCSIVATDSGGVQKEAYFHGKRCVTLRDETEWTELVDAGVNALAGHDADLIARLLVTQERFVADPHLYGRGDSAERIVEVLERWL